MSRLNNLEEKFSRVCDAILCEICELHQSLSRPGGVAVRLLLDYCKKYKLITNQQHGFLSKRSTVTNLLYCLNDWTCAIMNRHSVAVAYIDFQKAF